ncbi:MAG: hypothetical protein JJT76_14895 [Clostridiaceae bacterium]|nr:hypothetical protein [Clostridiaceae bacterium]
MEKKVLFIYNAVLREEKKGFLGECMTFEAIKKMSLILNNWAHQVVELNLKNQQQLQSCVENEGPFDLAFCIAEGFLDYPETLFDGSGAAEVRKSLEQLGVFVSHSSSETMEICRHKNLTYEVLGKRGIDIPVYFTIDPILGDIGEQIELQQEKLQFPLFVKPSGGGNSICISEKSIVHNRQELQQQIQYVIDTLGPIPVMVESYLSGREYTVGVIGNEYKTVLPMVAFSITEKVRGCDAKKAEAIGEKEREIITKEHPSYWKLYQLAVSTFDAVGASDVIRIDIREDEEGNPKVIDVNGTPTLTKTASLAFMAEAEQYKYEDLLYLILDTTLDRIHGISNEATSV